MSKKPSLPTWPNDPRLVPMATTLERLGLPRPTLSRISPPDAARRWKEFAEPPPLDLSTRPLGNRDHLEFAWANASRADIAIRRLAEEIHEFKPPPVDVRANDAGLNVISAIGMLNAALLLHLHSLGWHENPALILLRTALELVARGAFIATGTGSEATRFEKGPELPTDDLRRAARLSGMACCRRLRPLLARREPTSSDPYLVFVWLCQFTHFDSKAIAMNHDASPDHMTPEHTYAALTFVAWASAVVAEEITGLAPIADYPQALPANLPWVTALDGVVEDRNLTD